LVQFLVVDDYAFVRRRVGDCLKACGVKKFHNVENGQQAFDFLQRRSSLVKDNVLVNKITARPDIVADLAPDAAEFSSGHSYCVVTDFSMPEATGLEILKAIRCGETRVPRDTPVILLTGFSDDFVIAAALELDVNAFIVKPVSLKKMQEKLKRVLGSRLKLRSPEAYQNVVLPDEKGEISGASIKQQPPAVSDDRLDCAEFRWLPVSTIQTGAVLAKDLRTERGALLLQEGTVLSSFVLRRLADIQNADGFDGIVAVKN
jgi:CheY-like chemotaxis protein